MGGEARHLPFFQKIHMFWAGDGLTPLTPAPTKGMTRVGCGCQAHSEKARHPPVLGLEQPYSSAEMTRQ